MALKKCKECGKDVSTKAAVCPGCGAKVAGKPMGCGGFIVVVILAGIIVGSIANVVTPHAPKAEPSPPPEEAPGATAERIRADEATQRAIAGAMLLKKSMRDPDSFKLESALVIEKTGAVCYDFRAKNGFGGTNTGHAVLSSDGKKFKTSEMDGFSALWKKECAGKSGKNASAAINWFAL